MRHRMIRTIQVLMILLLGLPAAAMAQVPDGILVFDLSGSNEIYDFGNFSDCETVSEVDFTITLCLEVNMVPNGKGKYAGTAILDFSGDINGQLIGPASGSIKGSDRRDGSAKLKLKAVGFLNVAGFSFETKISLTCKGSINSIGFMTSRCQIKVTLIGEGSASISAFYGAQVAGGAWTITLNVMPIDEKIFVGTGHDTLNYFYTVKGIYNAKKGTSNVKATGVKNSGSAGAKFQLKNLTAAGSAEARYKVQGYKGSTSLGVE